MWGGGRCPGQGGQGVSWTLTFEVGLRYVDAGQEWLCEGGNALIIEESFPTASSFAHPKALWVLTQNSFLCCPVRACAPGLYCRV